MKVGEMKYERVDLAAVAEKMRGLTRRMAAATSGREMAEIRNESIAQAVKVQTMSSL